MRFRVVGLSIPSVPSLCLKDPQMGNNTIHQELLMPVGLVCRNKLPACRQFKDKKNFLLTINNYLLKFTDVTIIHPIYLWREIVALLSRYEDIHCSECIQFCSSHRSTREREIVRAYIRTPACQPLRDTH